MELCSFPFVIPCCYCSVTQLCLILCDPRDCKRFLCPPLSPGVCSNSRSLSWWCYLTISFSESPFSFCPQSFPGCMCAKSIQSCLILWDSVYQPARLLCPWDRTGKNTGVGCHTLLLGICRPRDRPASLISPALTGGFFTTAPSKSHTFNTSKVA